MAKCEEGYLCDVCGGDVEEIVESDLYLRYVIGLVDPETLHTTRSAISAAIRRWHSSSPMTSSNRSWSKGRSTSGNLIGLRARSAASGNSRLASAARSARAGADASRIPAAGSAGENGKGVVASDGEFTFVTNS